MCQNKTGVSLDRTGSSSSAILLGRNFWPVAEDLLLTVLDLNKLKNFKFSEHEAFPYVLEYLRILQNGTEEERDVLTKKIDKIIKGKNQRKKTVWFLFCGTLLPFLRQGGDGCF